MPRVSVRNQPAYRVFLGLLVLSACTSASHGDACDGTDHDGDGVIEDSCACSAFDVSFPSQTIATTMTWTGSEYLVLSSATMDSNTLIRIEGDGTVGSTFTTVPGVVPPGRALAWSGSELGVLSGATDGTLSLIRYDPDGTKLGATSIAKASFGPGASFPEVAWAGDRFVVTWMDDVATIPAAMLDEVTPDGVARTPVQLVANSVNTEINTLDYLAVSSTSYAVTTTYYGSYGTPNITLMDRASGTVRTARLGEGNNDATIAMHGDAIGVLEGDTFWNVSATDDVGVFVKEMFEVQYPVLLSVSSGYRAYGWLQNASSYDIVTMDLDTQGASQGGLATVLSLPGVGTFGGVTALGTADRFAIYVAYGAGQQVDTQRLIQICDHK